MKGIAVSDCHVTTARPAPAASHGSSDSFVDEIITDAGDLLEGVLEAAAVAAGVVLAVGVVVVGVAAAAEPEIIILILP